MPQFIHIYDTRYLYSFRAGRMHLQTTLRRCLRLLRLRRHCRLRGCGRRRRVRLHSAPQPREGGDDGWRLGRRRDASRFIPRDERRHLSILGGGGQGGGGRRGGGRRGGGRRGGGRRREDCVCVPLESDLRCEHRRSHLGGVEVSLRLDVTVEGGASLDEERAHIEGESQLRSVPKHRHAGLLHLRGWGVAHL